MWRQFSAVNLAYLQELYERYEQDPRSVEEEWRILFDRHGAPPLSAQAGEALPAPYSAASSIKPDLSQGVTARQMSHVIAASHFISQIRNYAHLAADVYPYPVKPEEDRRLLDPSTYGLGREELEAIPAALVWENAHEDTMTAWDAVQRLIQIYTKSTSYQFTHVNDREEREWLVRKAEAGIIPRTFTDHERLDLLYRLFEVEEFEHFLQQNFPGQKRFSIEGLDTMVPMLDEFVHLSVIRRETNHIMMGMAHRGRLNVLAHVLGKPYEKIFSEFHHSPNADLIPSEGSMGINYGWTGDVKYHMGANRAIPRKGKEVRQVCLTLANNPSHLEFVGPIVQGFSRAAQEDRHNPGFPVQEKDKAIAVLIHGDASFPGEGVVAETLNLSNLRGYSVGGTIHIVANNNLGFTTGSGDARSTRYASDLVKGFEIPIVHVNADDPEACLAAAMLAYDYRMKFHKDFLIDLIGYRRYGHNEADDPMVTQPGMYSKIQNHPTAAKIYMRKLIELGCVTSETVEQWKKEIRDKLYQALERMKSGVEEQETTSAPIRRASCGASEPVVTDVQSITTAVPLDELQGINRDLLRYPEDFPVYPKLDRILQRRSKALEPGNSVDWALAETLAFATILRDGKAIRLAGQDSERGTFAHRHMVLHAVDGASVHIPLHHISQAKASLAIHNSPLSEVAVLGFEYGYNVISPDTLVLWEAQFGDFVNTAQVIIDQFLAAGLAKWGELSGLVLLLPHGYEGQGPEHSSARLERFLQLAAEENWVVCNPTSAAQYFHLLRKQSQLLGTTRCRPLIVMTPKSLLRHPRTGSPAEAFSEGSFSPVILPEMDGAAEKGVGRLILCSGKIAVDLSSKLAESEEAEGRVIIARLEQLYPFPEQAIAEQLSRLPHLREIVWVQEEPRNMGAWTYVEPRLRQLAEGLALSYVGRPERASTAEGYPNIHQLEQQRIVAEALQSEDWEAE